MPRERRQKKDPPEEVSSQEDATSPRWRRRKEARPEELIESALELFSEQGFASTKLRDVARRAGVSKGTVYLYFPSKEALLLGAVQRSVVPILDFGDDYEIESESSASELLAALVQKWIEEFERRSVSGVPKLVIAESASVPELGPLFVDAVLQRARRLFARVLKRGMRTGEFRSVDVKEAVHLLLAPLLYAQIHQHALGSCDPGIFDMERYVATHIDFFLRAMRPDQEGE